MKTLLKIDKYKKRSPFVKKGGITMKNIFCLPVIMILSFNFWLIDQHFSEAKGGAVMELSSLAFNDDNMIPDKYTCDGADVSLPLEWGLVPEGTKSIALICDDPDAPVGTWVHWVYYDIPADTKGLPENIAPQENPDNGGKQGTNDFRRIGYGGPCPPGGTHRYYFKIYALDTILNLPAGADKKKLLKAMEGHIIGQAQIMGKYKR
jgi:Raf kinase inhibitor-like YbhB/YbcL family protein